MKNNTVVKIPEAINSVIIGIHTIRYITIRDIINDLQNGSHEILIREKIGLEATIFSWKINPPDQNYMENWSKLGPVISRIVVSRIVGHEL